MSALLAWVAVAGALLAPARPSDQLAPLSLAIATRAEAEPPLFKGDVDRHRTSALLVAIAFRESSLRPDAVGDHVAGKPTSFCAFQLHLPWGATTAEGWTGAEVAEDPEKCVTAAMRLIRESMRVCPTAPLAWYAAGPSGCESVRAQRISRDRLSLAQRLVRDVKMPSADPSTAAFVPGDWPSSGMPLPDLAPVIPLLGPLPLRAHARPRLFCGGA